MELEGKDSCKGANIGEGKALRQEHSDAEGRGDDLSILLKAGSLVPQILPDNLRISDLCETQNGWGGESVHGPWGHAGAAGGWFAFEEMSWS